MFPYSSQRRALLKMSVRRTFADAWRSPQHTLKRLQSLQGEDTFEEEFLDCLLRLLSVPKAETQCLRLIKIVSTFLTTSTQWVTPVLSTLLPYLGAKDRTVRYRAVQITVHVLKSIPTIDDDMYIPVRHELIKRLHDKLPAVRNEVASVMPHFLDNEDPEEANEEETNLLEKVLDVLRNDSNAQVRRTLLAALPLTAETLPYLFERARDKDESVRRAVFEKVMPSLSDFRHLSVAMREKTLRWGFRDTDEKTRNATARLVCEHWIEDCVRSQEGGSDETLPANTLAPPSVPALKELLERIDVINTGTEGGIAQEAMYQFWKGRPDYFSAIEFDESFWTDLTPESAFMIRTFSDYCKSDAVHESTHEEKMPEVSQVGYYLQQHLNTLLQNVKPPESEVISADHEERLAEDDFIVEQLLHMTQNLDYSDEIGKRRMFALLRESIAIPDLPEDNARIMVDALRLLTDSRQFCDVVLEAIAEIQDLESPDIAQDALAEDKGGVYDLKRLQLATAMLQNIKAGDISDATLAATVETLVVPAVRAHGPVRVLGLKCLALCCLLDVELAKQNLELFRYCARKADGELRLLAIKSLSDLGIAHQMVCEFDADMETEEPGVKQLISQCVAKGVAFGAAAPVPVVDSLGNEILEQNGVEACREVSVAA